MAEFQPPTPGHQDDDSEGVAPETADAEQHLSGVFRAAIAGIVSLVCLALVPLGLLLRTMEDVPGPEYPATRPAALALSPGKYVIVIDLKTAASDVADDEWPDAGCVIAEADGTPVEITPRENDLPAYILNGRSGTYRFQRVVGSFTITQSDPIVSCSYQDTPDAVRIHRTTAWYAAIGLDVLGFLVAVIGVCGIFFAGVCAVRPGKFHGLALKLVSIPVSLALIALVGTLVLRWLAR